MTDVSTEKRERDKLASFEAAFCAVGERVDRTLTGAPALIRGYTTHLTGARGKLLRAASVLACAQEEDGSIAADAVDFAAAIELLHLATLVHDDIIDDADTRRGIPSLQRKFGKKTAVICGDYLLSVALRLAASVPDRSRFDRLDLPDYVSRVCLGELRQNSHNGDLSLSITEYLRIIRGKTAALFEASFFAGAILCETDEREVRKYARLGRYIGMIFQLTDDCLDYDSDTDTAKKPVQSDYEQGVVTLPLIHALHTDPELERRARDGLLDATEVAGAVRRCDGVGFTRLFARRYYDRAAAALASLDLSDEKRARLADILERSYCGLKRPS